MLTAETTSGHATRSRWRVAHDSLLASVLLLLVAMPGAPSSVLAPSSGARRPSLALCDVSQKSQQHSIFAFRGDMVASVSAGLLDFCLCAGQVVCGLLRSLGMRGHPCEIALRLSNTDNDTNRRLFDDTSTPQFFLAKTMTSGAMTSLCESNAFGTTGLSMRTGPVLIVCRMRRHGKMSKLRTSHAFPKNHAMCTRDPILSPQTDI